MVLDRIIIAITIITVLFLLFKLIRVRQLRAARRTASALNTPHESQILYFSSTVCSQCVNQEKVLNEIVVGPEFQDVSLNKYSIEDDAELAQQWGVKTLPTTILLSDFGEVRQINNGLVSTGVLTSQLRELKVYNSESR